MPLTTGASAFEPLTFFAHPGSCSLSSVRAYAGCPFISGLCSCRGFCGLLARDGIPDCSGLLTSAPAVLGGLVPSWIEPAFMPTHPHKTNCVGSSHRYPGLILCGSRPTLATRTAYLVKSLLLQDQLANFLFFMRHALLSPSALPITGGGSLASSPACWCEPVVANPLLSLHER